MAVKDSRRVLNVTPLTGGLETRIPPTLCDPSMSPDLDNVVLTRGAVEKRGGFVPLTRQHPRMNAIRNVGYHARVDEEDQYDAVTVSGCMLAGDRAIYDQLPFGFSTDFFLRIDDLTREVDGNPDGTVTPNPPFELRVRPIISKGPTARSLSKTLTAADYGSPTNSLGLIHWDTTATYGPGGSVIPVTNIQANVPIAGDSTVTVAQPHGQTAAAQFRLVECGAYSGVHACTFPTATTIRIAGFVAAVPSNFGCAVFDPEQTGFGGWCVYLYRGTGTAPWKFRFSAHTNDAGTYKLRTVESSVTPEVGAVYHVIASWDFLSSKLYLRIGKWDSTARSFTYTGDEATFTGVLAANTPCPIQVFDCPQEFIEAPSADVTVYDTTTMLSRPPGLGLTDTYYNQCKRFEGVIEDITIRRTMLASTSDSALDRHWKLDIGALAFNDVLSYWSMLSDGENYVKEETGRGNHLYLCPSGPVYDGISGGIPSDERTGEGRKIGSWWFGGGDYAIADVSFPWYPKFGGSTDQVNADGWALNSALATTLGLDGYFEAHPNWGVRRTIAWDGTAGGDSLTKGFMWDLLNRDFPVGMQVAFWADSVGEPFEKVIAEIHGVLRIALRPDRRLAFYVRDDHDVTSGTGVQEYQHPILSETRVAAGHRYEVTCMWLAGSLFLLVNGVLDSMASGLGFSTNGYPPGAITFGIGAHFFTVASSNAASGNDIFSGTMSPLRPQNDSRTGFIGRIEFAKILVGDGLQRTFQSIRNDEATKDWARDLAKMWHAPPESGSPTIALVRTSMLPHLPNDTIKFVSFGNGVAWISSENGIRSLHVGTALDASTVSPEWDILTEGGALTLDNAQILFFHCIANWTLDDDVGDVAFRGGRFEVEMESYVTATGFPVTSQGQAVHPYRGVAEKLTSCGDKTGFLGPLRIRCIRPDYRYDDAVNPGVTLPKGPGRSESYQWQSPPEVAPQWAKGIAQPLTETTRPSLLVDWHHQESGERFLITAAGRQVYWIKPIWRNDSPFPELDDGAVWLFGEPGDHIEVASDDAAVQGFQDGVGDYNTQAFELWFKPEKLNGHRVLACRMDVATGLVNFIIALYHGSLVVAGHHDAGTGSWIYHQGINATINDAQTTDPRLGVSSVKLGAWNHVALVLGAPTGGGPTHEITAWVNGNLVTMTRYDATATTGGVASTLRPGGVPNVQDLDNTSAMQLYIGGLPVGFETLSFPISGETLSFEMQSFAGLLTEYVQDNDSPPGFTPAGGGLAFLPAGRNTEDANSIYLLHLNEMEGWVFTNAVTGEEQNGGVSQINEMIAIAEGLSESSGHRYQAAVFRDALFITNGESRPQEIRFLRFTHPDGPFQVSDAGIDAPITSDQATLEVVYSSHPDGQNYATGYFKEDGTTYDVWGVFADDLDRESEPTLLGRLTPSKHVVSITESVSVASGLATITLAGPWPSSVHPGDWVLFEVDGANAAIGAVPTRWSGITKYTGPSTYQLLIPYYGAGFGPTGAGGVVGFLASGVRVVGLPRSTQRHVTRRKFYVTQFAGGSPTLHPTVAEDNVSQEIELSAPGPTAGGQLIEFGRKLPAPRARCVAVGQGSLVFAHLLDVAAGAASFAWSDGEEPTWFPVANEAVLDSSDGKMIVGMASSLGRFYLSKRDSVWAFDLLSARPVNQGVGLGGGLARYDNVIFGASDRGVYRFDGSNMVYISASLEGDWSGLPLRDEDLLNHFGAFSRRDSQYWISVRREGFEANTRIYVLHTNIGDRQAWTRLSVPRHTYMANVINPVTQRPEVVIATTSGQILAYRDDVFVDGHDETPLPGDSEVLLQGLGTANATNLVVAAGTLDTIQDGLRGLPIAIVTTTQAFFRRIERNTGNTIYWSEPITGTPFVATFIIGYYDAYWSSKWFAPQTKGAFCLLQAIDLEFAANDTSMTVSVSSAIEPALDNAGGQPAITKPVAGFLASSPFEIGSEDLSSGYQNAPVVVNSRNRGRYVRVGFSTSAAAFTGIRSPWQLQSFALRFFDEGVQGGRPR